MKKKQGKNKKNDFFISHASEDKDSIARPLADTLISLSMKVWYDEYSLNAGDSLSESIAKGLSQSRHGIIILSPSFFKKKWTKRELQGVFAKNINSNKNLIIPIWHNLDIKKIIKFNPILADIKALDTAQFPIRDIALSLLKIIRPQAGESYQALRAYSQILENNGIMVRLSIDSLKNLQKSPVRYATFPEYILVRMRLVNAMLADVLPSSFEDFIDDYSRDLHPVSELSIMERILATLTVILNENPNLQVKKQAIFNLLISYNVGADSEGITKSLTQTEKDYCLGMYHTLIPDKFISHPANDERDFVEFSEHLSERIK